MTSFLHPEHSPHFAPAFHVRTRRVAYPRAPIALALRLSRALFAVSAIAGLVALPVMALAMRRAKLGSLRAHFVWLGSVCYLLYASVLASFSLQFNALFL